MPHSDTRRPAVAGMFYPADAPVLRGMVDAFLQAVEVPATSALGAIAPHAGLVYSGQCAAHVLGRIEIPAVVVILAPNHTGRCAAPGGVSVWTRGRFSTPLGDVPVAEALADALLARCDLAAADRIAHGGEHAIEVELPFLQVRTDTVEILPIVLAWDDWRRAQQLATALAELVAQWPQPVLLLASSDMTHYESAAHAAAKDRIALAAIERLDAEPPDLVLADIAMPGRDGYAVALHVRQTPALAHVPVILLTGALAWQLALAGHAAWLTANAARAAARAEIVGRSANAAARSALPRSLERNLEVKSRGDGRVRVSVRIPWLLRGSPGPIGVAAESSLGSRP